MVNISAIGTPPPPSITSDNIPMDVILANPADKAVKSILPFLKELSSDLWWTDLLEVWIDFENKGPPKSVSFYLFILLYIFINYII